MMGFSPVRLAPAHGSVWAIDPAFPLLVRCDVRTRTAVVAAQLPVATDDQRESPPWSRAVGPVSLATGAGGVWLALPQRRQLALYRPDEDALELMDVPMAPSSVAANDNALYAVAGGSDGRLLIAQPDAGPRMVDVGTGLVLVAVAGRRVWVVDDAAGQVIALDAESVTVAQRFARLAAPGLLMAREDTAWYLSHTEVERRGEHGQRERASLYAPDGLDYSVSELSAATGRTRTYPRRQTFSPVGHVDAQGLWISGARQENLDDVDLVADDPMPDPISTLSRLDFDGQEVHTLTVAGQLDALAVLPDEIWVGGFRRSRQQFVVTVLSQDGTVRGEVDLTGIDVTPWLARPPQPVPRLAMPEFVGRVRAALEENLSRSRQWSNRFGEQWAEPPIAVQFRLLRVEASERAICVIFVWQPGDGPYGMRFDINPEDLDGCSWGHTPEQFAADLLIDFEENLLAGGYGIENARKTPRDGTVWLDWTVDE